MTIETILRFFDILLLEDGIDCYKKYQDILAIDNRMYASLDLFWMVHLVRSYAKSKSKNTYSLIFHVVSESIGDLHT